MCNQEVKIIRDRLGLGAPKTPPRRVFGKCRRSIGNRPYLVINVATNSKSYLANHWQATCNERRISKCSPRTLYGERKDFRMLSHCANLQCRKPFLRLREGRLFLVETERVTKPGQHAAPPFVRARRHQRQVEHYWLCDDCANHWTLIYDRERGVALAPARPAPAAVPSSAQSGVA